MYKVEIDTARNRIYITLIGFFSIEEMKRCGDETIERSRKLKRGYDVVGQSSTSSMQFKRTGDLAEFQSTIVETLADAEKVLAGK